MQFTPFLCISKPTESSTSSNFHPSCYTSNLEESHFPIYSSYVIFTGMIGKKMKTMHPRTMAAGTVTHLYMNGAQCHPATANPSTNFIIFKNPPKQYDVIPRIQATYHNILGIVLDNRKNCKSSPDTEQIVANVAMFFAICNLFIYKSPF